MNLRTPPLWPAGSPELDHVQPGLLPSRLAEAWLTPMKRLHDKGLKLFEVAMPSSYTDYFEGGGFRGQRALDVHEDQAPEDAKRSVEDAGRYRSRRLQALGLEGE